MLAVHLDQMLREIAEQSGGSGLVVDEAAAAAVRLDDAAHDQRLAGVDVEAVVVQQRGDRAIGVRGVETRGDDGLRRALPHQSAIGAVAQRQAERVEQDRLARPGLAGQHAKAIAEFEFERFDQHDVTNGERGQHRAFLNGKRAAGSSAYLGLVPAPPVLLAPVEPEPSSFGATPGVPGATGARP